MRPGTVSFSTIGWSASFALHMEPPYAPPPQPGPIEPQPPAAVFPLTRDDYAFSDLLSRASEAWSRDLGPWLLVMVLYGVIGVGIPAALGLLTGVVETALENNETFNWVSTVLEVVSQVVQLVISAIFTFRAVSAAVRLRSASSWISLSLS